MTPRANDGGRELSAVSQTHTAEPVLRIRDLGKSFRSRTGAHVRALTSVDLDVHPGEFVALLGPSGCGKTTLLRLIAGLETFTDGELSMFGCPVAGPSDAVSMVFQGSVLLPWKTIRSNILLPAKIRKQKVSEWRPRADELLESTGLAGFADHYPRELSGGMRQRAAICRALLLDPPVLLMDEPFGALDAITREQMNQDLHGIWLRTKKTIVFVTHDIAEAVRLASKVVVMSARPGRVVCVSDLGLGDTEYRMRLASDDFSGHVRRLESQIHDIAG